jgi:uncharacterized protein YecE (DUF72 family)
MRRVIGQLRPVYGHHLSMATLFVGTSGFSYPAWKPGFYPADVPVARFLEYYSMRLNCLEVNYTFRRAPAASTLQSWVSRTPSGFLFAVKAHQRITHRARLKDAQEPTEFFLKSLEPLRAAGRLGPILLQLPPSLRRDDERLATYLALLPPDLRFAVEFRHLSWFADDVYALLRERNVALCVAESEELQVPQAVTADFGYFRMRKPPYTDEDVARIAVRVRGLVQTGFDQFVFFKHEEDPAGALEAEKLLRAA